MRLHNRFGQLLIAAVAIASAATASAFTTSQGQTWDTEPDAWTRGNTADASWFGWDVFEFAPGEFPSAPFGSYLLNDTTPDLGSPTTATGTSIAQDATSFGLYGHKSSSGNYYSGFPDTADGFPANAVADDTITGTAPASGSGGYTTLLLQVIGQAPGGLGISRIQDLSFTADSAWTKTSDVYNHVGDLTGRYWQEWTAPGANVPFTIDVSSLASSIAIDAFQIDTYWTPGPAPVVNSRTAVPEPSAIALLVLGAFGFAGRRR